jgi:uncharacterized protein YkwD
MISWSSNLQASAQDYANRLQASGAFQHSGSGVGENLYRGGGGCTGAVDMWMAEAGNYYGQPIGSGNFGSYGHYTQILYPAVSQVGCGVAGSTVVCHYDAIQQTGSRV